MPDIASLYPLAPLGVPPDLAKPGLRYRLQAVLVLLSLFLFLLLYFALLAGAVALMFWALWPGAAATTPAMETWLGHVFQIALRASVFAAGAMLFVFLSKGILKRGESSADLEVTEQAQPELFHFIHSLCREIGCPAPTRVYLSHEVNAAVLYRTSILNLIVPARKKLLLGLGLVNGVNLAEFKALLGHELGHFSQRTLKLDGYVRVAYDVIFNMLNTRDQWDNWVIRGFDWPGVSIFAVPLYGTAELTRWLLRGVFRVLQPLHMSLRRQMEFQADLVAVSVAGSDAPVHLLLKCNFSQACLQQAAQGLALAAEQRLFTRDLFMHQERAGEFLRAAAKNPDLGRPPDLPADPCLSVGIFQPGDESTATVWADHPSDYDRERNAKQRYFRSPLDDRPAWLLFHERDIVREQVTRQFYRTCLNLEPDDPLADPERVQSFIDEEQAAAILEPRYQGLYEGRFLQISSIERLIAQARKQPVWPPEQVASAQGTLCSEELRSWTEDYRRRRREFELLQGLDDGTCSKEATQFEFRGKSYPRHEAKRWLEEVVRAEAAKDFRRLASLDRKVFLLHDQLARRQEMEEEFHQRYRFHFQVQQLHETLWQQRSDLESVFHFLSGRKSLHPEELGALFLTLRDIRSGFEEILSKASCLLVPALKHMTPGEQLLRYMTTEPLLSDLETTELALDNEWIGTLRRQLDTVLDKLNRVLCKSLGGILTFQERLSESWTKGTKLIDT